VAAAVLVAVAAVVPVSVAAAPDEAGGHSSAHRTRWRPGNVLSAEPFTARLVGGVPLPARAWRIVYGSRTATRARTRVSGTVLVPDQPWTGDGSRPLLGFAVGTQGLADRCAPSAQLARGSEYEAPMIAQALDRGWAVAVTDYPGLGTRGDHTYVVERANGRAVLDSMRAARRFGPAGLAPQGPNVVYGYSEGGGAAAGAIELQPTYAPGLRLRGAFVGAAPADYRAVLDHVDGSPIAFLMGYAAIGFQRAYPGLDLDRHLTAAGRDALARLRDTCIQDAIVAGLLMPQDRSAYFTADPFAIPALRRRFRQNSLGHVAPRTPVLLGAARNDEVIPYPVMTALRRDYCALGVNAHFRSVPLAEHLSGALVIAPAAMQFLADRLAGEPLPRARDC
jgi:hypothetical protein